MLIVQEGKYWEYLIFFGEILQKRSDKNFKMIRCTNFIRDCRFVNPFPQSLGRPGYRRLYFYITFSSYDYILVYTGPLLSVD